MAVKKERKLKQNRKATSGKSRVENLNRYKDADRKETGMVEGEVHKDG